MRILLFAILAGAQAYGQSHIDVDNPAPRLGSDIAVSFVLEDGDDQVGRGSITLTSAARVGPMTIGPFSLVIAGKRYETDSVTLSVAPKLPADIKDGLWLRVVDFDGGQFLIVDQRISGSWKKERKADNQVSMTHVANTSFAELKEDLLKTMGIKITASSSRSGTESVETADGVGSELVSYKTWTYKILKTSQFKDRVKIDERNFDNAPRNLTVDAAWIE